MKRTLTTFTLVMAALLLGPHSGHAQTNIILAFDSLPSDQGWTYFQGDVPEASVFSAIGTSLVQNTIGIGFGDGKAPNYARFGIVDGSQPFVLTVRARVLAYEGTDTFGFFFDVRTAAPNQEYAIGFTTSLVTDPLGNSVALDTTAFHDYVLTATPGSNYSLYIDGQLRLTGPPSSTGGALNAIQIGDGNNQFANAHAEITQFIFSQPAIFNPPPVLSCSPGFLPPFDVSIGLKKNQNRAIPVKMTLHDSTGSIITDTSIVAPVVNVEFTSTGGAAVNVTSDLLPLGAANTDNVFRFDPTDQTWIYNLGTKFFASPGTYGVTAKAGDASYLIDASCSGTFVRFP